MLTEKPHSAKQKEGWKKAAGHHMVSHPSREAFGSSQGRTVQTQHLPAPGWNFLFVLSYALFLNWVHSQYCKRGTTAWFVGRGKWMLHLICINTFIFLLCLACLRARKFFIIRLWCSKGYLRWKANDLCDNLPQYRLQVIIIIAKLREKDMIFWSEWASLHLQWLPFTVSKQD